MTAIGQYILFIIKLFKNREKFSVYVGLVFTEAMNLGINSIVIVTIVSTFIGAVTCIQTAANLVSPFIPDYIIALVVRDMTILELSPTIISIVLAGKVGSHIAGELGTMKITEQVDALEVMGINSVSYLVLPKVIAALVTFPMLVIISAFLSLLGGYVAGVLTQVITPEEYIRGLQADFIEFNVIFAIIKALVFSFLISTVSAFKGYNTSGGALEVGKSSTAAVTSS
jgi:phospholipid/cholesterol/gamma-HCH transport system permease protein